MVARIVEGLRKTREPFSTRIENGHYPISLTYKSMRISRAKMASSPIMTGIVQRQAFSKISVAGKAKTIVENAIFTNKKNILSISIDTIRSCYQRQ